MPLTYAGGKINRIRGRSRDLPTLDTDPTWKAKALLCPSPSFNYQHGLCTEGSAAFTNQSPSSKQPPCSTLRWLYVSDPSLNVLKQTQQICTPAGSALHVIAAFRLLNPPSALWTVFATVFFLPFRESIVAKRGVFVLLAGKAFVVDSSAMRADRGETGGAGEEPAVIGDFVHLIASGGRTILIVTWMRADMACE